MESGRERVLRSRKARESLGMDGRIPRVEQYGLFSKNYGNMHHLVRGSTVSHDHVNPPSSDNEGGGLEERQSISLIVADDSLLHNFEGGEDTSGSSLLRKVYGGLTRRPLLILLLHFLLLFLAFVAYDRLHGHGLSSNTPVYEMNSTAVHHLDLTQLENLPAVLNDIKLMKSELSKLSHTVSEKKELPENFNAKIESIENKLNRMHTEAETKNQAFAASVANLKLVSDAADSKASVATSQAQNALDILQELNKRLIELEEKAASHRVEVQEGDTVSNKHFNDLRDLLQNLDSNLTAVQEQVESSRERALSFELKIETALRSLQQDAEQGRTKLTQIESALYSGLEKDVKQLENRRQEEALKLATTITRIEVLERSSKHTKFAMGSDGSDYVTAAQVLEMMQWDHGLRRKDWAHAGGGAQIIYSQTSYPVHLPASAALDPDVSVGNAFCFAGEVGSLAITLPAYVNITSITLDMAPVYLSYAQGRTAPKVFTIYGLRNLHDHVGVTLLEDATFRLDESPVQTFSVSTEGRSTFRHVRMNVKSNYGSENTCIYRLRVHGEMYEG